MPSLEICQYLWKVSIILLPLNVVDFSKIKSVTAYILKANNYELYFTFKKK